MRGAAGRLFEYSLPAVVEFRSPRACAYSILGIQQYLHSYPGDRDAQRVRSALAQRLLEMYESVRHGRTGSGLKILWPTATRGCPRPCCWWDRRAAMNACFPPASILWTGSWKHSAARRTATSCRSARKGFTARADEQARFDQQPVEAAGAVSACLQAYRVTGDERWRRAAWSAFNWFLGDNDLQLSLYDSETGGCRDGLHPDRANQNQGAESTLSFLMALLEMRSLQATVTPPERLENSS